MAYIVTHLLHHKGVKGAAVGRASYGLVKQIFLLDDSTVKERILEIRDQGFVLWSIPRTERFSAPVRHRARSGRCWSCSNRHLLAFGKRSLPPPPPRWILQPGSNPRAKTRSASLRGIILAGAQTSAANRGAPALDPHLFDTNKPVAAGAPGRGDPAI